MAEQIRIEIQTEAQQTEAMLARVRDGLQDVADSARKGIGRIEALEAAQQEFGRLQTRLNEARRELAYFQEQARGAGEQGLRAFGADIRATEKEIERLERGLARQGAQVEKLAEGLRASGVDTRDLAQAKAALADKALRAEKGVISLNAQIARTREQAQDAAGGLREAGTASAQAAEGVGRLGERADAAEGGIGRLAAGLKLLAGAAAVREFVQANASLEAMTRALESVTGSAEAARQEMDFVRAEAMRLGLEVGDAAGSFTQLAAAAKGTKLEGAATREIWSAVAEAMARLGKSSYETDGALRAIAQMMSKGTVQAEELRGQLGERLPGAFQAAARALGTTTEGLNEMLQRGEVVAADFLPRFAAELRRLSGGGGEIDTFAANLARLKNAVNEAFLALGETGAFNAISAGLRYAAAGVVGLVQAFDALGRTLGNVMYTVASLDFRGFAERQREIAEAARERWEKTGAAILGTGESARTAAEQTEAAMSGTAAPAIARVKERADDLHESLRALGLDAKQFEDAEVSAQAAFERIAGHAQASAEMILSALMAALDKVSKEAAPQLEFALQEAFQKGRISAAQLETGLEAIRLRAQDVWVEAKRAGDALEEAFRKLGLTSSAALRQAADEARRAYEVIRASQEPLEQKIKAWEKYAQAAIASGDAVRVEMARQEASALGVTEKFAKLAQQAGLTGDALKQTAVSTTQLAGAQGQLQTRTEGATDALARQATVVDELAEAERRRLRQMQAGIDRLFEMDGKSFTTSLSLQVKGWDLLDAQLQKEITEMAHKRIGKTTGWYLGPEEFKAVIKHMNELAEPFIRARELEFERKRQQTLNELFERTHGAPPTRAQQEPRQQVTHAVQITLPSGRTGTVQMASARDAEQLTELLRQLDRSRMVSA